MSSILLFVILALFMAFTQFLGILIYKRFERFCDKIKNLGKRPEVEQDKPVENHKSKDLMEDI